MVSYQRWTAIVFDVAKAKGVNTSEAQTEVISAAAEVWNRRKDELSPATVSQAERVAESEITVQ